MSLKRGEPARLFPPTRRGFRWKHWAQILPSSKDNFPALVGTAGARRNKDQALGLREPAPSAPPPPLPLASGKSTRSGVSRPTLGQGAGVAHRYPSTSGVLVASRCKDT